MTTELETAPRRPARQELPTGRRSSSPSRRNRWLIAAGAAGAAGLVWLGIRIVADRDGSAGQEPVASVTVSGVEEVGPTTTPDGKEDWSGFSWMSVRRTTSDERADGSTTVGVNSGVGVDRRWVELTNEDGEWIGMATGTHELTGSPPLHEHEELLVGTGAYEGLQLRTRISQGGDELFRGQRYGTIEPFGTWAPGAEPPSADGTLSCEPAPAPLGWDYRDWSWSACRHASSDARVAGTARVGWIEDSEIRRAFVDLTTEEGRWRGTFVGVGDEDGHRLEGLLIGTGDLRELEYRLRATSDDGTSFDIEGVVERSRWFRTERPPVGDGLTTTDRASVVARTVRMSGTGCGHAIEGSGFPVGENLIATAAHVTVGAGELVVETLDGRSLDATVVALDGANDVALLSVAGLALEPFDLRDPPLGAVGVVGGWYDTGRPGPTPFEVLESLDKTIGEVGSETSVVRPSWRVATRVVDGYSGAALIDAEQNAVGLVYGKSGVGNPIAFAVGGRVVQQLVDVTDPTTEVSVPGCP